MATNPQVTITLPAEVWARVQVEIQWDNDNNLKIARDAIIGALELWRSTP